MWASVILALDKSCRLEMVTSCGREIEFHCRTLGSKPRVGLQHTGSSGALTSALAGRGGGVGGGEKRAFGRGRR